MTGLDVLAPTCASEVGLDPTALGRLRDVLQADIASDRLPGAVALVARHGRTAWQGAWGRRDPAACDAMRIDTIFRIYSMTKPIVSVAAMMLVEQGRLQLTDPVGRFLAEFASTPVGVAREGRLESRPADRPMTVHDLLRHTSGLTYEFTGDSPVQRLYAQARVGDRSRTNAEASRVLAELPLLCSPGAQWEYSRSTDVLGRLVEVVADQALGAFLAERITGPLGMVDTGFHVPAAHHARIAEPFPIDPDVGTPVRLIDVRTPAPFESGGGGMVSTAPDYARFLQMLLDGGTLDGVRLLGRKTVELMTADHLGSIPVASPLLVPGYGFGLGFAVRLHAGLAPTPGTVGQYGWGGIGGTAFWVDPRERLVALFLSQAPGRRDHYRDLFRNMVHAALID